MHILKPSFCGKLPHCFERQEVGAQPQATNDGALFQSFCLERDHCGKKGSHCQWDLFEAEAHNHCTAEELERRNQDGKANAMKIWLQNVFNSAVLQRDGHTDLQR